MKDMKKVYLEGDPTPKERTKAMIDAFVEQLGETGEPMVLIGAVPHDDHHDIYNELNSHFSPDDILQAMQELAERIVEMTSVPQPILDRVAELLNTLDPAKGETHGRKIGFVDKTKVN